MGKILLLYGVVKREILCTDRTTFYVKLREVRLLKNRRRTDKSPPTRDKIVPRVFLSKFFKLVRPQRQGVESCPILVDLDQ